MRIDNDQNEHYTWLIGIILISRVVMHMMAFLSIADRGNAWGPSLAARSWPGSEKGAM